MIRKAMFTMAVMMLLTSACYAQDNIKVVVNHNEVQFEDQGPEIIRDRTYIPLRSLLEMMGCELRYNSVTSVIRIYKNDTTYAVRIGSPYLYNYNTKVVIKMEDVPIIKNGRTLVPIRYMTELAGAEVSWLDAERTVNVMYEKAE